MSSRVDCTICKHGHAVADTPADWDTWGDAMLRCEECGSEFEEKGGKRNAIQAMSGVWRTSGSWRKM